MSSTVETATTMRYAHQPLGEDVPTGIAGYYTPFREVRLPYRGRTLLYVVGRAVIESSCCGSGAWDYAVVPGYLVSWHSGTRGALPTSEVELITDRAEQEELRRTIETAEHLDLVTFW